MFQIFTLSDIVVSIAWGWR